MTTTKTTAAAAGDPLPPSDGAAQVPKKTVRLYDLAGRIPTATRLYAALTTKKGSKTPFAMLWVRNFLGATPPTRFGTGENMMTYLAEIPEEALTLSSKTKWAGYMYTKDITPEEYQQKLDKLEGDEDGEEK